VSAVAARIPVSQPSLSLEIRSVIHQFDLGGSRLPVSQPGSRREAT